MEPHSLTGVRLFIGMSTTSQILPELFVCQYKKNGYQPTDYFKSTAHQRSRLTTNAHGDTLSMIVHAKKVKKSVAPSLFDVIYWLIRKYPLTLQLLSYKPLIPQPRVLHSPLYIKYN